MSWFTSNPEFDNDNVGVPCLVEVKTEYSPNTKFLKIGSHYKVMYFFLKLELADGIHNCWIDQDGKRNKEEVIRWIPIAMIN